MAEDHCAGQYVGDNDRNNVIITPLLGYPKGLPPTYIQVCSKEIFFSDSDELYKKAKEAGVDVGIEVNTELWHAWLQFVAYVPEAKASLRNFADWANTKLD